MLRIHRIALLSKVLFTRLSHVLGAAAPGVVSTRRDRKTARHAAKVRLLTGTRAAAAAETEERRGSGATPCRGPVAAPVTGSGPSGRRALARVSAPAILVGHSWGGFVITAAGTDERVAGLVYVAALAPDAGETPQDLIGKYAPPPLFSHLDSEEGRLWINRDGISDFCGDLPQAEQQLVWATQGSAAEAVLGASTESPAWRTKPSWFVISTQDRAVDPELQRFEAGRMGATVVEVDSSHVPMLSHPRSSWTPSARRRGASEVPLSWGRSVRPGSGAPELSPGGAAAPAPGARSIRAAARTVAEPCTAPCAMETKVPGPIPPPDKGSDVKAAACTAALAPRRDPRPGPPPPVVSARTSLPSPSRRIPWGAHVR